MSFGLRDDPIQPLVIRANQGDCVQITVSNNASGGAYGMAIDGLPYDRPRRQGRQELQRRGAVRSVRRVFRYFVPNEAALEGAHYISPGAGHRAAIDHGLFGVLSVEPPGSQWLSPVMRRHRSSPVGKRSSGRPPSRRSVRTCRSCTRSATRRRASTTRTTAVADGRPDHRDLPSR